MFGQYMLIKRRGVYVFKICQICTFLLLQIFTRGLNKLVCAALDFITTIVQLCIGVVHILCNQPRG